METATQLLELPITEASEFNAGLVMNEDGTPSHWLALNTVEHASGASQTEQLKWAESLGLDLPTSQEQSLLKTNASQFFEKDWYWSKETHKDNAGWAWSQDFYDGYQSYSYKSRKLRARAVRRIPVSYSTI